jgi:hypothetical protein
MRGIPERTSRYGGRDPEREAQNLKRRFQAVSERSFSRRGPREAKHRSWSGALAVVRLAAIAAYIVYTWVWRSNLWPSEQVRSQAASITDCASARRMGIAPLYKGFPGYSASLDRDGDGIACEPYPF